MTDQDEFTNVLHLWMDAFMHRSMSGLNHFARCSGLPMQQFSVMMQLYHKGSCGMSEISDRFGVTPAAASQLVDRLVHAGYLERTEDLYDRRAKYLTLSTSGSDLIRKGLDERYRWMDHLAEYLSPTEQEKISEALTLLTNAAREFDNKNIPPQPQTNPENSLGAK